MNKLLALLLLLACSLAEAQVIQLQPFSPNGNTITFTAAGSCPSPVQAVSNTSSGQVTQYLLSNTGSVLSFISWGTSAEATANCVIPTSTSTRVIPLLPTAAYTVTLPAGVYFTGINSGTNAVIYVTPGNGS